MKIVKIDVSNLHSLQDNPRTITPDDIGRLRSSIKSFGLFKPFLVWLGPDGLQYVISGNQRLQVLQSMAASGELPLVVALRNGTQVTVERELPCVEFGGSEAEARAVALRDNNSDGEWDWNMLPSFVAELSEQLGSDADLAALTGFDTSVLDDLQHLNTNVHVDVDYTGDDDDEDVSHQVRKKLKFSFGKVSGMVPLDLYDRFLKIFAAVSNDTDSKEITVILAAMLDRAQS